MVDWNREDLAYCGGLFDGEGCIYVPKKHSKTKTVSLYISMTDEDVVRFFHEKIQLGRVGGPYKQTNPRAKEQWRWAVHGPERCQAVLAAMWPWLGKRRRQKFRELMEYCKGIDWVTKPKRENAIEQDTCYQGHDWTGGNSYYRKDGRRDCKICAKEYRERKKMAKIKDQENAIRY